MNNQRSFFGFFVAGAIALLVIVLGGFYWFFIKSPVNLISSSSQPSAAAFVSKLSPVTVSLLANPDRLQALEREGELSKLKTSLLAKSSIDYKEDIQPWLGDEITLAITTLDIDRDSENGQQPGYLMALATNKPDKSREFIELLFSKRALAGANLEVEQYKGIKLLHDSQPKQDSLAGAAIGENFVLFANDPKVLREAINNIQAPDLNLTSSPEYQTAAQQLPKGSLAVAFLNLPTVAKLQGLELSEQTYDSEIISLGLNPKGLLAETTFLTSSPTVASSRLLSQPIKALRYIPTSAGLAISGSNLSNLGDSDLAKLGKQLTATLYGSKENATSRFLQPLAEFEKRWGINLAEDIFSWIKGEYALALLPQKAKTDPSWVFVVEQSEDVQQGVSHLDAIATSNGLNIIPLTLEQQKISAWTELATAAKKTNTNNKPSLSIETKVRGVHTTVGNYEIFTSDLEILDEILTSKNNSLIDNPNFQDSIAAIPQPNQGYIYLDWTKSHDIVERQLPILKVVEILGQPFFNRLRSLTLSSYSNETGLLKGGVFFQLNR
ncbi:MAG: DUF3352 domain-containing protein [Desmonostoc vinosum HA7617-LM4]|jgi:hypothetical protein|nr:DUF3352 domain-containing protein [Desmonostoc vinosum HA7617-LM4]